ncbi:MAG TPA: dienelactone hydrolase family protein, partial [Gemmataceae bacterium]|nr:dienelactone hydrolase family protein [Gemmataceae bacterium]
MAATAVGILAASTPAVHGQDDDNIWQSGPSILHQPPATAPQLTNAGPWTAPPLLVSGAHAYVHGEFVYQDFLYDDSGANGNFPDPNDKRPTNEPFSSRTGTYSYPSGPGYLGNAADLVELRVKPLDTATALRLTLTELSNPSLVAATIGIGTSTSTARQAPDGANVSMPADHFVTVHENSAHAYVAYFDGASVPVSIDQNRAQIDIRIPHAVWNPGTSTVRLSAGVGLWDAANGKYLLPSQASSAGTPGGAGTLSHPAAFFNVAFRENEKAATVFHPTAPTNGPAVCMWRDCSQSAALAGNDISSFHDDVDFAKLAARQTDMSGVPATGSLDRIFSSHFQFGDGGVTYANSNNQVNPADYDGEYQGRLQPYNLYVPKAFNPGHSYPLTLLLHSLSANYNQYMSSNNQSEFGERDGGTLVATDNARGPDGWYYDSAEADVFEMWADIAKHYRLDLTRTALTGYSMGGYATYKLGTQFPDLFAKAFVTVGPPADGIWTGPPGVVPATGGDQTNTYFMLDSLRNLPILIWHGTNDELVPADGPQLMARRLDALNYRYEIDTFPGYDHFAFASADNYDFPTQFLDSAKVVTNPPHITYVVNPTMDFADVGLRADHVYWLSGLTVRDPSQTRGTLDVRSEGFCTGDAAASATQFGSGVAATPYTREYKTWGDAPSAPCADTLDISATNVSHIVVDARRARVDCNATINLSADGPVDVKIVN